MEWLGLQLFADLPATGRIVIDCRHEPFLVLLAYLVACAACFASRLARRRALDSGELPTL